jgi:hypothetical protein
VDCRCQDVSELHGDEALAYVEHHLRRVRQEHGAWLLVCSLTGQEWVEDFPRDTATKGWVGTCRLRRFPWHDTNPS